MFSLWQYILKFYLVCRPVNISVWLQTRIEWIWGPSWSSVDFLAVKISISIHCTCYVYWSHEDSAEHLVVWRTFLVKGFPNLHDMMKYMTINVNNCVTLISRPTDEPQQTLAGWNVICKLEMFCRSLQLTICCGNLWLVLFTVERCNKKRSAWVWCLMDISGWGFFGKI